MFKTFLVGLAVGVSLEHFCKLKRLVDAIDETQDLIIEGLEAEAESAYQAQIDVMFAFLVEDLDD